MSDYCIERETDHCPHCGSTTSEEVDLADWLLEADDFAPEHSVLCWKAKADLRALNGDLDKIIKLRPEKAESYQAQHEVSTNQILEPVAAALKCGKWHVWK